MKALVQRARHLSGTVADVVRRAVDPPLDANARPLDVKRAIVEAIEREVEPAGNGRRVLPGGAVQVKVLAEDADRRRTLELVLADIRDAAIARLRELRCEVDPQFTVEVTYVRRPAVEWAEGQRLAVRLVGDTPAPTAPPHDDRAAICLPTLAMTVVRGDAGQAQFAFTEPVVRIGRSPDPTDDRGRPRFNHVAFLENDTAENRTVTRGHAVIRFSTRTREYRLFDEGSANGTRVVRGGETIDLPRRDPVGFALRTGDEVQFGKAAVRIAIG